MTQNTSLLYAIVTFFLLSLFFFLFRATALRDFSTIKTLVSSLFNDEFYFFLISKCDCLFLLREVFFYSLNVEAYTRSTVFSQRENRIFYSNSIFVSSWMVSDG